MKKLQNKRLKPVVKVEFDRITLPRNIYKNIRLRAREMIGAAGNFPW